MASTWRRWRLVSLILALLIVTSGCNLLSLPYFLFPGRDTHPPECTDFDAPKKEIKLVFLTYVDSETRPEFLRADRDLSELLVRQLRERYKENKDKVVVVPPNQVENFKDRNPNWHTKSMQEIGAFFHADYVINIELDRLGLYEPKSLNEFFRGQANASVAVSDMKKPEEGHVFRREFSFKFPTRGPRPVMDNNNPVQFRAEFLNYVVNQLAHCFASYTTQQKFNYD